MAHYSKTDNRKMWVFSEINIPYCGYLRVRKIIVIFALYINHIYGVFN